MKVTLSNTGNSITLTTDNATYDAVIGRSLEGRFDITFEKGRLHLKTPKAIKTVRERLSGSTIQRKLMKSSWGGQIQISSEQIPEMPKFGIIYFDGFAFDGDDAILPLPKELPAAKVTTVVKKAKVKNEVVAKPATISEAQAVAPASFDEGPRPSAASGDSANASLTVAGETVRFELPSGELLKLAMGWAKKGYVLEDA